MTSGMLVLLAACIWVVVGLLNASLVDETDPIWVLIMVLFWPLVWLWGILRQLQMSVRWFNRLWRAMKRR